MLGLKIQKIHKNDSEFLVNQRHLNAQIHFKLLTRNKFQKNVFQIIIYISFKTFECTNHNH